MAIYNASFLTFTAIICLSLVCIECDAQTQTINTSDGIGADAFIRGGNFSNQNSGSSNSTSVKHDPNSSSFHRKAYYRFDTSSVESNSIQNAMLTLTVAVTDGSDHPSFQYRLYGLVDGHVGENWDEFAITWNNAPANINEPTNMGNDAILLTSFSTGKLVTPGDQVNVGGEALTEFLNNDTNEAVTLMITRETQSFFIHSFATKENLNFDCPTLQISTTILGDVNCDGAVNLLDVAPFVDTLSSGGFSNKADINQDGSVDLLDVTPFVVLLSGG